MSSITKIESIAYHEAGHAVAAFFLHLRIGRKGVTIIPDKIRNSLGSAQVLNQLRESPDISISPRTYVRIEDSTVVDFAGDAAQKKFDPRRRFGGHRDMHNAIALLLFISGSEEIVSARLEPISFGQSPSSTVSPSNGQWAGRVRESILRVLRGITRLWTVSIFTRVARVARVQEGAELVEFIRQVQLSLARAP